MLRPRRIQYLSVLVILLTWLASRFLKHVPGFPDWPIDLDQECIFIGIVAAALSLVTKRWSALATFSLLIAVLILGDAALFAYRLNNVCGPGDHIIQSEADAIERAQIRILQAHYGSHGIPGYVDEKPGYVDFSQTDDCCRATRTRTISGVIIWEVGLQGETVGEPKKRYVNAYVPLSNCGVVFVGDSFLVADPKRIQYGRK
jgi:hypothetical protein